MEDGVDTRAGRGRRRTRLAGLLRAAGELVAYQALIALLAAALAMVAKLPVLNLANRIMGGGIGLLKGVLVVGLVCWVILRLGLVTAAETQESVFLQFFSNFSWARG